MISSFTGRILQAGVRDAEARHRRTPACQPPAREMAEGSWVFGRPTSETSVLSLLMALPIGGMAVVGMPGTTQILRAGPGQPASGALRYA